MSVILTLYLHIIMNHISENLASNSVTMLLASIVAARHLLKKGPCPNSSFLPSYLHSSPSSLPYLSFHHHHVVTLLFSLPPLSPSLLFNHSHHSPVFSSYLSPHYHHHPFSFTPLHSLHSSSSSSSSILTHSPSLSSHYRPTQTNNEAISGLSRGRALGHIAAKCCLYHMGIKSEAAAK